MTLNSINSNCNVIWRDFALLGGNND